VSRNVTSVSLERPVHRAVKESGDEFSTRVNEWARQYYVHGHPPIEGEMIEAAREELVDVRESVTDTLDDIDRAIEAFDQLEADFDTPEANQQTGEAYTLAHAREAWRRQPWQRSIDPDDEFFQTWAQKVGMEPEELADELSRVQRDSLPKSLREDSSP